MIYFPIYYSNTLIIDSANKFIFDSKILITVKEFIEIRYYLFLDLYFCFTLKIIRNHHLNTILFQS